jgi:hypothetical protein
MVSIIQLTNDFELCSAISERLSSGHGHSLKWSDCIGRAQRTTGVLLLGVDVRNRGGLVRNRGGLIRSRMKHVDLVAKSLTAILSCPTVCA